MIKKIIWSFLFAMLLVSGRPVYGLQDAETRGTRMKKEHSALDNRSKQKTQKSVSSRRGDLSGANNSANHATSDLALGNTEELLLGYTLFLKGEDDEYRRVNPTQEFQSNQRLRFKVESSADGYLYVFHQENNGKPVMLYPHWEADQGRNLIRAYHLEDVPSGAAIEFDEKPAIETFLLIFSRKPLTELPTGLGLKGKDGVPVPEKLYQRMFIASRTPELAGLGDGELITPVEQKRGVKLKKEDPLPGQLIISEGPRSGWVVAKITLVHK
ncbi:MAG TPA: DUF4384 domain-containing protein [Blastocatellia bacterium]|nr:DUF4384 domain-containing protein [Blastocatellia bacterium]